MITGRCECGQVEFEADGDVQEFSHCHCSQCRRLHGSAFASFIGVKTTGFRYISKPPNIACYSSSENHRRVFCRNCGSNILVALTDYPDELYVCMGTVDGNPTLPEPYHMFVGSKAPWHEITDNAQQFEGFPPET